ncbi:MAG: DUF1365 domain-containing protein [Vibrionaceae bacterium]
MSELASAIWQGEVNHRRFAPVKHSFDYSLFMMGIDLDELAKLDDSYWFAVERRGLLSFHRQDYLPSGVSSLKQAVWDKVAELGGSAQPEEKVEFLGNVRCLGVYFSPVNFYFCYQKGKPRYLLAEVSNTPWRERHCYLLDLENLTPHDKAFHVSPFMGLAMRYHWHVQASGPKRVIHIASHPQQETGKLFDATLKLTPAPFDRHHLRRTLWRWPVMTGKILFTIYWQALRLFIKRVPIFDHPKKRTP